MISPFNLLQEQRVDRPWAPWRILVCCTLLNRTHGRQVRPMVDELFEAWPGPKELGHVSADERADLVDLIRPLGFANQRSTSLVKMSHQYWQLVVPGNTDDEPPINRLMTDGEWVRQFHGCGQYAVDSINVFRYGILENVSSDTWLQRYVDWKKHAAQPDNGWRL